MDKQTSSRTPSNKLTHDMKRMKLTQLDYLANPLRTDHPFGKYDIRVDEQLYREFNISGSHSLS